MAKGYRLAVIGLFCALHSYAAVYTGRVVDEKGAPISYATVYPEVQPEVGTATNSEGYFQFEADLKATDKVVVSFIGYEKVTVNGERLMANGGKPIVLKEQPIALEETVVAAKPSKQRNKRKQMAALLHSVYVQMAEDFPLEPAQYEIVSDVAMQSEGKTWGMEQMIGTVVVLPQEGHEGFDSVQFHGRFCKRFFDARKRAEAEELMAGETLEHLDQHTKAPKGTPDRFMRRAANSIDSGVVVHRELFAVGNIRQDFEQNMNDRRHWSVSNESEGETVLTHTQKTSKYMGLFTIVYKRHYIVDSHTYAVRRFSQHADVSVTIPFGYKLNEDQLKMFSLLSMNEQQIARFRLRKVRALIDLNTIYQRQNGKVYILEKNMHVNARFTGSKKTDIPLQIKATQRVTGLQTQGVKPLRKDQITRRLERKMVEIY